MALMGVFTQQPWRHRHREEAYGHRGGGRETAWREQRGCGSAPACVNRQPGGICCVTQGAHMGPLE